jgi:hypothetical protein
VGKKAKENSIPITVIAHPKQWITASKLSCSKQSIYYNMVGNDAFQTEILNSFI